MTLERHGSQNQSSETVHAIIGRVFVVPLHHSYVRGRSGGGTSQLFSQHNAEFSCVTALYFVAFLNVGSLLA